MLLTVSAPELSATCSLITPTEIPPTEIPPTPSPGGHSMALHLDGNGWVNSHGGLEGQEKRDGLKRRQQLEEELLRAKIEVEKLKAIRLRHDLPEYNSL